MNYCFNFSCFKSLRVLSDWVGVYNLLFQIYFETMEHVICAATTPSGVKVVKMFGTSIVEEVEFFLVVRLKFTSWIATSLPDGKLYLVDM